MAINASDIKEGAKGKAVYILHTFGDSLWEMGSKADPPETVQREATVWSEDQPPGGSVEETSKGTKDSPESKETERSVPASEAAGSSSPPSLTPQGQKNLLTIFWPTHFVNRGYFHSKKEPHSIDPLPIIEVTTIYIPNTFLYPLFSSFITLTTTFITLFSHSSGYKALLFQELDSIPQIRREGWPVEAQGFQRRLKYSGCKSDTPRGPKPYTVSNRRW